MHVTTENHLDWRANFRGPILLDHVDEGMCVLADGASIHGGRHYKDARFEGRLAAKGVALKFIPPYCWFLSPLDNGAFGRLVQFLRANSGLTSRSIEEACEAGFMSCMSRDDVKHCWYKCGYTRLY